MRRLVLASLLLLCACSAAGPPTSEELGGVHRALLEAFSPRGRSWALAPGLKEWDRARGAQAAPARVRAAWASLARPAGLRRALGRSALLRKAERVGFAALSRHERGALVAALFGASEPELVAQARALRSAYLPAIYSTWRHKSSPTTPPRSYPLPSFKAPPSQLRVQGGQLLHAGGEIDTLIVGSGPAGSALACALAEGGQRVLVIEQGSFVIPGALDTRSLSPLMELQNRRTSSGGALQIRNGRAVGGGSTVNIDLAFAPTLPFVRSRIASWVAAGRLPARSYSPSAIQAAYRWVKAHVQTRALSEAEINANNAVLWEGARARGYTPRLYALNRQAPGADPRTDDKVSATRAFLLKALHLERKPLSLLPDARVERILLESGRVSGVAIRIQSPWTHEAVVPDFNRLGLQPGRELWVRAKRVVLAAGALGSPALLLRSGIGGAKVGRGLVLHPSLPLVGLMPREINATRGLNAAVYVDHFAAAPGQGYFFEAMSGTPPYVAAMVPGDPGQVFSVVSRFPRLAGFGVMLVDTPHPENRVRLESGRVVVDYRLQAGDRDRFRRGVAEAARLFFAAGAKAVVVPSCEAFLGAERGRNLLLETPAQVDLLARHLAFLPNQTLITSAHMQGTLKLGVDAKQGAVSPEQRVFDAQGQPLKTLYVCDASLFPSSAGANPMQTIYTLSKVFAERLLQELPASE